MQTTLSVAVLTGALRLRYAETLTGFTFCLIDSVAC